MLSIVKKKNKIFYKKLVEFVEGVLKELLGKERLRQPYVLTRPPRWIISLSESFPLFLTYGMVMGFRIFLFVDNHDSV